MIARGNIHSSGAKLAAYLINGGPGERAELIDMRGVAAGDLVSAFTDLQHISEATNCEKPFFHGYVRLPDDERLSRADWMHVADKMERALGFQGQPRAVALHHGGPEGNHLHIGWYRIDLDRMTAIDPGLYINKMREAAAALEIELGLRQIDRSPSPDRMTKTAKQPEFEQAKRLDTDLDAIRNGIRECWNASDGGEALQAAIAERGWILAQGDRRDFLVIDSAGGDHALGKRICGVTAGEVKQRLGGDEFKRTLPTVAEAKAMQLERQQEREQQQEQGDSQAQHHDDRQANQEHEKKRGGKESGRAKVTTDDGGMVAQQREALRSLTKTERLARLEEQQDAAGRSRSIAQDRSRHRTRGR